MGGKYQENLRCLAEENGLRLDEQSNLISGVRNGYRLCLMPTNGGYQFSLSVSVSRGGGMPNAKELQKAVKAYRILGACTVQRYRVNFMLRLGGSLKKVTEKLPEALDAAVRFLSSGGYQNCCQSCGTVGETGSCLVDGAETKLCQDCFAAAGQTASAQQQAAAQKRENVVGGIVGALLGGLLGAGCIVLLGQLGYVAGLSGVVLAVCTVKGYELLGGKLSKAGTVISILIMLFMVYIGNRADWAITIAQYFEVDFLRAFQSVSYLLQEGYLETSAYYGNLALVYLFALCGAIPTILAARRAKKLKGVTYQLT